MKKNYISPLVRAINIQAESSILAGSNPTLGKKEGEVSSQSDVWSNKRQDIWGDED